MSSFICPDHPNKVYAKSRDLIRHFSLSSHASDADVFPGGSRVCKWCEQEVLLTDYPEHIAAHQFQRPPKRARHSAPPESLVDPVDLPAGDDLMDVDGVDGGDDGERKEPDPAPAIALTACNDWSPALDDFSYCDGKDFMEYRDQLSDEERMVLEFESLELGNGMTENAYYNIVHSRFMQLHPLAHRLHDRQAQFKQEMSTFQEQFFPFIDLALLPGAPQIEEGDHTMPFLSLVQVLKYWCLSTHTAQFIAQHCKFSSVLERVRRLDDEQRVTPDAFVHAKNTGTRYRRVVKELAVHYETLPEDVKAKTYTLQFELFGDGARLRDRVFNGGEVLVASACEFSEELGSTPQSAANVPFCFVRHSSFEAVTESFVLNAVLTYEGLERLHRGVWLWNSYLKQNIFVLSAFGVFLSDIAARSQWASFKSPSPLGHRFCPYCTCTMEQRVEYLRGTRQTAAWNPREFARRCLTLPEEGQPMDPLQRTVSKDLGVNYASKFHRFPHCLLLESFPPELLHLEFQGLVKDHFNEFARKLQDVNDDFWHAMHSKLQTFTFSDFKVSFPRCPSLKQWHASYSGYQRMRFLLVSDVILQPFVTDELHEDFNFQHIGILSLEFHVDKLSRPLL